MTWYFSCPLPATSTRSPGRASSIALAIAAASTIDDRQHAAARLSRRGVGRDAALDLLDDPRRILAARVVGRDDDEIAQTAGDGAHQRPLRCDRDRRRSRTP